MTAKNNIITEDNEQLLTMLAVASIACIITSTLLAATGFNIFGLFLLIIGFWLATLIILFGIT